jgi:hypothetical protein
MLTLTIIAVVAWFAYSHMKKKKYEAEAKRWSVEHRKEQERSPKRIRWKDLT